MVYGPANPVAQRLEDPENAVIDVVYRRKSGPSTSADIARWGYPSVKEVFTTTLKSIAT